MCRVVALFAIGNSKLAHFLYYFRPGSAKEAALDTALQFLNAWEAHAKGLGFLSRSTSEGLRVTIQATKELLKYLTERIGFKYLMT